MTNDVDETEDFETVLPLEIEDAAVPIPLSELKPWHHPRKQYVRERQWQHYTKRLLDKLSSQNRLQGDVVRYLTLPGIDYFDVEILGQAAKETGLRMEATGFLAEASRESIRARSQFRADSLIKRGLMEDTSITFPYRFEEIASRKTQAYREIKARAPFHIVNIDACGSLARPTSSQSSRIVDGIHQLMELQFESGRTDWALFLTTDARPDNVAHNVTAALKDAIVRNARESSEFKEGAVALFSTDSDQDLEYLLAHAETNWENFLSMFSLGFSKWILHVAADVGWDLKSRQFYCYSTRPSHESMPSMACMAFEFSPQEIVLPDPFGIVQPNSVSQTVRPDYSMKALERARNMDNLDIRLETDSTLMQHFTSAQRQMLENAGYQAAVLARFDEKFS